MYTSMVMILFVVGLALLLTIRESIKINTFIKMVQLRKNILPVINDDVARVWNSFFESYLFVYANSKTVPNEKEFLAFRDSFYEMFKIMIGPGQCDIYSDVFNGDEFLKLYIYYGFEKHFKIVFVEMMIDKNILDDDKSSSKGEK